MSWWTTVPMSDSEVHEMPIEYDSPEIIPYGDLSKYTFDHVPFTYCRCKPNIRFNDAGDTVLVCHRDPGRGQDTADGKDTLQ